MGAHDAFISYSRRDRALAQLLEQRLEKYRPPRDLNLPYRYLDIFRDESDFTGPEYRSALKKHLADSASLIVLCSPAARESRYVDEEIREFAASKGTDKIVAVLVGGIPNNEATPERERDKAFPQALCDLLEMPLAANYLGFDASRDRVDRGAYFDAWSTILANVFGVSRSELEQRERKRRARFVRLAVSTTAGVVALLVTALIVTLISRFDAVAQAIAARRETSTRLAVQALEKLDGSPEEGLALAIQAVEVYREHGDPPVARALESLHKARLSFGGGRPLLPWREDQATLVYSPDLQWAATSADDGTIRFARAGSGTATVLPPPAAGLPAGQHWSDGSPSKLSFTDGRLFAARTFEGAEYTGGDEALIWYWPLADAGAAGPPEIVGRIERGDWSDADLVPSYDGRWLSWGDGRGTVFVKAVGAAEPPLAIETREGRQNVRAFSPDLTELVVGADDGWQRVRLDGALGKAEVAELLESNLADVVAFATAGPAPQPIRAEGLAAIVITGSRAGAGLGRLALLDINGDGEWWDLESTPAVRHELPNLFAAYSAEMQIVRLEARDVRGELSWNGEHALLASVVHGSHEFGIAAWVDADAGAAWTPVVVQQLQSQTIASTSSLSGNGFGATSGYRLLDQKKLGAAAAYWYGGDVITLGFDGTLMYRDLERGRESVFGTRGAVVAPPGFDDWIAVGGQDGALDLYDTGDEDGALRISGHDAPVAEIARTEQTIVTVDTAGAGRVWTLANSVLDPDGLDRVTPDWRWAVRNDGSALDLSAVDPFAQAASAPPALEPICAANGCESFATVEVGDDKTRVQARLWSLRDGQIPSAPDAEREYVFPALPDGWSWSRSWLAVGDGSARLLMTGSAAGGTGAWIVNLADANASPQKVVDAADKFEIKSVSENLRRLVVVKGDGLRDEEHTELRVLALDPPAAEPVLVMPKAWYGDLSPDGRWLARGRRVVYDLDGDRSTPRFESGDEFGSIDFVLAADRPPLYLDDEGDLWGVDGTPGAQAPSRELLTGQELTEVAWDRTGKWLGLGNGEGRAWLVATDRADLASLAAALAHVDESTALPAAWDPAARDKIYSLQFLAGQGLALAETDDNHRLLWRRDPSRGWSEPLVFSRRELHDGSGGLQCRPDGKLCVVEGQVMSFDEPQLIAASKGLLSGRVGYDVER